MTTADIGRAAEESRQPSANGRASDLAQPSAATVRRGLRPRFDGVTFFLISLALFALYVLTLAPTALRSDSGEFHVMPWVLGIAHAPGYPLLTLLGRLVMFLPIGDPAYRVNLLDAAAAAAAVGLVYLTVVELAGRGERSSWAVRAGGLAAAAALGLGAVYWQQSLVGGPRPFIFFFTALLLWLLFRWSNRVATARAEGAQDAGPALVLLAAAAGLAVSHHPNLGMLFPGFALYLLARDPRLVLRVKQLGLALLAFAIPLLLYAYIPLRSAMEPALGAHGLANLREFFVYVTATHYQDAVLNNCGGSRLIQAQRYLVFLMLQFGPLLPAASLLGAGLTLVRAPLAGLVLIYAFASNAIFGTCSSLAMPDYIIPSFVVAASWLGLGPAWLFGWLAGFPRLKLRIAPAAVLAGLVLGLSAYRLVTALPYQSMTHRTADFDRARDGMSQTQPGSLILSDWESITPVWYAQHVTGLNAQAQTRMVTASPGSDTWLIEVEQGLKHAQVALAHWVPALGDKYRLFPIGSLHEVADRAIVERGNAGLQTTDRAVRLLGYRVDRSVAEPGDLVHLTLYQKSDRGHDDPYLPVLRLATEPPVEFHFSGSLHTPLPTWSDNEVVGEVYQFSIPSWVSPGTIPLEMAYRVDGRDGLVALTGGDPWTEVGFVEVAAPLAPALPPPASPLANFSNQFVMRAGKVGSEPSVNIGGPAEGVRLQPGGVMEVEAHWSGLRWMDDSYTIFVHLLDGQHQLIAQQDALPLGGVYHTYKWVPGQVIADWYRLSLPENLPPGDYWLEFGAYHSVTTRRLPVLDDQGGSKETSFLWGPIRVE